MNRRRVAATFILLWLVSSPARADQADPIDEYVKARMAEFALPGVSLAILEDGKITRIGAYGTSDVARATPATPETVYKIASVSKQFIATAIMLLVQEQRLTLDDPVSKHLEGTPTAWQPITIRHLLTHTAGLVRESPAFDPRKDVENAAIVRAVYAVPLRFPPGSKWEYSNAGYFALAEIITRVAGQPWPDFVQQRIFKPAGMTSTAATNATPALPNRARGYTGTDNRQPADEWTAVRPSGAFLSTVVDLAKWDALLYTSTVLSDASRQQMWAPVALSDGTTHPYGLGWHSETTRRGGRAIWHGGGLPGFASYFGRFDDRLTVILLTNGNDVDMVAVANGLADLYLKLQRP